ncbi:MAG TPA: choice-of-anchor B family protein, partial [Pyrinomonadaceae bacterium]|nr:choice-of-anchor B family protein [Pyrinomonadaceae bacterium]
HGMQVFDLTRLRSVASPPVTFTETAHYDGFSMVHTIAINEETGFLYAAGSTPMPGKTANVNTCPIAAGRPGGGLHIVDVKNPAAPAFAGCVNEDGYTHEAQCVVYRGPDAQYRDHEICFNANEDTVTIVDVTNKAAPVQLSRTTYVGRGYTHQGWLTEDHRMLLVNDELDENGQQNPQTKTFVWDVSDLDAPFVKNVQLLGTTAIDHNLYVRGRYVFESNYRSGLRVLDAANATTGALNQVAFFDVFPADDQPLFNGSWHNYPYFASGTVLAAGIEQGLFVLRPRIDLPVKIDYAPFFVRQQYLDFLSREPDEPGLAFWSHAIAACVADVPCTEVSRVNVSTAFFVSIEFLNTGYLVHRFHAASFPNSLPTFQPFTADLREIGEGIVVGRAGWEQELEANKQAFALEWVARPAFVAQLPANMSATDYVNALFTNAGANATQGERDAAVAAFGAGGLEGRARALRSVADSGSVYNRQYNPAFVLMQYFGYLRRDPDAAGFQFWLDKLDSFTQPGEDVRDEQTALNRVRRAEMVRAFITSIEYRARFGQQ